MPFCIERCILTKSSKTIWKVYYLHSIWGGIVVQPTVQMKIVTKSNKCLGLKQHLYKTGMEGVGAIIFALIAMIFLP